MANQNSEKDKQNVPCSHHIDLTEYKHISAETKQGAETVHNLTLTALSKAHLQEIKNLDTIMKQISDKIQEKNNDDGREEGHGEVEEKDNEDVDLTLLETKADLFNKLIQSINSNSIAASAIITYNSYWQTNQNKSNNDENNHNNDEEPGTSNSNSQLQTFANVYDILYQIHGYTELWPHFANLVEKSLYLQPYFWSKCGYAVGYAISDLIKMIILGNIWMQKLTQAKLEQMITQAVYDFNAKLTLKKTTKQKEKLKLLTKEDVENIIPTDPKV